MLLFFHIPKSSIASAAFEVESMERVGKINGVRDGFHSCPTQMPGDMLTYTHDEDC